MSKYGNKPTWTINGGEKIVIENMRNSHLMNTINFVLRKSFDIGGFKDGDKFCFRDDVEFDPPRIYIDLCNEADKRGLLKDFETYLIRIPEGVESRQYRHGTIADCTDKHTGWGDR